MSNDNNTGNKFDPRTIIIIVLLLASIIFGSMWFYGGNDASKEKVKQLESDFKKLEAEKAAADAKISEWKDKYTDADRRDKTLSSQINGLKIDSKIAEEKAKKSKADLDKVQNGISENRKEIEDLKKNPPKLTDEELLASLIKKTN
jgi:chromosome segregation ATPase